MNTALKTEEEKKEYFDTEEEIDQKVDILVDLIQKSKHFIAFTGAGISTSTGIKDFRSGVNTALPTGPGVWEKLATGYDQKPLISTSTTAAIPSPAHMALVKLQEVGRLKYLISQNTDGLHRRSGFPPKYLAELHGNSNLEICKNEACGKQYLRDYKIRSTRGKEHRTGRYCENCGEALYDTVVAFGEKVPQKELQDGYKQSEKADLCLSLGSSLRVTPASNMPYRMMRKQGKLVIVNLQATPFDEMAKTKISTFIDNVMIKVMAKLGLEIPPFILKRRVAIVKTDKNANDNDKDGKLGILVKGVDSEGTSYTLFRGAKVRLMETEEEINMEKEDPLMFYPEKPSLDKGIMKLNLAFWGHYHEPELTLEVSLEDLKLNEPIYYLMEFDPQLKEWVKYERTTVGGKP